MKVKFQPPPSTNANAAMYEVLLARGNGLRLVTVHRGEITKVTPVKGESVCVGVKRPETGLVDNAEMLLKLLKRDYGQYLVGVCWGKITKVDEVDRDNEVKVQDLARSGSQATALGELGLPERAITALESAGIHDVVALRDVLPTLTTIKGIGDALAAEIYAAVDRYDEQNPDA